MLGTYLERHNGRDVFDEPGNAENHIGRVAVLFDCTIYLIHELMVSQGKARQLSDGNCEHTLSCRFRFCASATADLGTNELRDMCGQQRRKYKATCAKLYWIPDRSVK